MTVQPPLDLVALLVLSLAAHRVTRFVTDDTLLGSAREAVEDWSLNGGAVRLKLIEGLLCPYCIGVWIAWAAYGAWVLALDLSAPFLVHMITATAVAGGSALLVGVDGR